MSKEHTTAAAGLMSISSGVTTTYRAALNATYTAVQMDIEIMIARGRFLKCYVVRKFCKLSISLRKHTI